MDRRISSSIDNNIPARHYQLFGVPDLAVLRQQYAWSNIPAVVGDSEPSTYSMALAEALGCRLYGVLSQISQAELDIFHGRYNHDDHHHQPPAITEVVKATSSQEATAAPQVSKEEERGEEAEEENTTAVMKEDEILEEEEKKEEEMMAAYYKTDQKLHEQLMRKHYYPKYSRKSCRSSRKRSSK